MPFVASIGELVWSHRPLPMPPIMVDVILQAGADTTTRYWGREEIRSVLTP